MNNFKKIVAIMICSISTSSWAQETLKFQAVCHKTEKLFEFLNKEHGEFPIVAGYNDVEVKRIMTLWVNPSTNTWTFVLTNGDQSCVIADGRDFTIKDGAGGGKKISYE